MTVKFYTSQSCTSCRKARLWLKEHGIAYTERNIINDPLTFEELKAILRLTENGTEDLLSVRSQKFHTLKVNVDELSVNALLRLMAKHPELVRRPILVDGARLQVGYIEDEMRRFMPRRVRTMQLQHAQLLAGV